MKPASDLALLFVMMALPKGQDAAQVGGSAKSPFRLLKWLAPMVGRVHVVATDGAPSGLPANCSGRIIRLRYARLFIRSLLQSFMIGLHLALNRKRYDIVQSHHPHLSAGIAVVRKLGLWRGTFVLKAHGTAVPEIRTNDHKGLRGFLLSLNAKVLHQNDVFALREADFVICSSKYQMAEMRALYGVPDSKLVVIYNGFDPDVRADAVKSRTAKKRRMVFCGRVVPKKNAPYAIDLFSRLRAAGIVDGLDLIMGHQNKIENRDACLAILDAARTDPQIKVHFDLTETELYQLFSRATLGVVPSIGYESIPSVIYEIASCGTPVFATGQWGIPEVLPERYQLTLDMDRDVDRVMQVFHLGLDDTAHAVWSENYRYDRLANQYIELYSKGTSS